MDVHKHTISLASFNREENRIYAEVKIPTKLSEVIRYLDARKEEFEDEDVAFKIGYESGCLGTWLAEDLNTAGYDCVVMAANTIAKSSVQTKKKNDSNDAEMIARALGWNQYSAVHLLDKEDKEKREVVRLRQDFVDDTKRAKQRLSSFLLRHNLRYESGKRPWTQAYMKWLHSLHLEGEDGETLAERIKSVEDCMNNVERMTERLDKLSKGPRYQENAAKLGAFKGVAMLTAMTVLTETGDFSRFPSADHYASWVGCVPSDYSSGGKTVHGGITKTGNRNIRCALIEATQAMVKGQHGKTKTLRRRQAGLPADIIAYADRGTERIRIKFFRMRNRGVSYNKAITACARELACFIWGMMTGHTETREMNMFSKSVGCDPLTGEVCA